MGYDYTPELQGVYLEDSYLLGFRCEGPDIHLDALFAVTLDHPEYRPPSAGEQHCYGRGALVLREPVVGELKIGSKPTVLRDPDGTLDLGSIELYRQGPDAIRVVTDWFELTAEVKQLLVILT
jgi:hypothetical protein